MRLNHSSKIIHIIFQILSSREFRQNHHVTREFIERLGLQRQLVAHEGCVNCVQWSDDGEYLASGMYFSFSVKVSSRYYKFEYFLSLLIKKSVGPKVK